MISCDAIVELYRQRKKALTPQHDKMVQIRDQYNNLVRVPLPELDKNEVAAVANLISQGIDQMAMRIASTVPSITYPPLRRGIDKSENYAEIRRLANYSWWQQNRFDRKQRKRAKWLVGYAVAPAMLRPNFKLQIPGWHLTDPLHVFPSPMADPDDICPQDGILAYMRTVRWAQEHYPEKIRGLELGKSGGQDTELEILEYVDADEHVLCAIGKPIQSDPNPFFGHPTPPPGAPYAELERYPNRVGKCTLVYPTRPSLECPISQFDGMPAVYRMQARAMALWVLASERQIFPDTWVESELNQTAEIIELADGRAGIPGRIKGGHLKEVSSATPPQVGQIIELMDRNMSRSASLSPEFGGQQPNSSAPRTGRAGEQLLSATVDYWVQEAQETLGLAYEEENRLAVKIAKCYFGDIPKSFYVNWGGAKTPVDYIPNTHFETDNNIVSWPQAGSDINSLVVGLGQRLGLGEISLHTAMRLDPYIDDPEEEERLLATESVRKAFLASLDQAVASGQIGPKELADLEEKVSSGQQTLYQAYQELHQDAQEQQAASSGGQPGQGPMPGTPESMPGLSAPGQQAALGLPAPGPAAGVAQPPPGLQHMQMLQSALRNPQR